MKRRVVTIAQQTLLQLGPVEVAMEERPDQVELTWVAVSVADASVRCGGSVSGPAAPARQVIQAAVESARGEVVRLVQSGAPSTSWRVAIYYDGHLVADRLVRVLCIGDQLKVSVW